MAMRPETLFDKLQRTKVIVGGFLVIGYWQSYDIKCVTGREWSWKQMPPQFVCKAF